MRRLAVKALVAIAALGAIACLGAYVYLRQSLPLVNGTVRVAGISAPLEIVRDADAIPHIFASTRFDALVGLGYVHAQDRLWQMELQRRIGHGRLAEIFGPSAIAQDRFLRTVGFGRAARASWATMPEWAKEQVNAYIAGVNAFIVAHHGRQLPPEFTLLRFEPELWDGADVVVWVKMMAWDLSANYGFELLRHDLVGIVGVERMRQLMPPYPPDGLSILGVQKLATTEDTVDPEVKSVSSSVSNKRSTTEDTVDPEVKSVSSSVSNKRSTTEDTVDTEVKSGFPSVSRRRSTTEDTVDTEVEPGRPSVSSVSSVVESASHVVESSWFQAFRSGLSQGEPAVRDLLLGGAGTEGLGSNNWVVDGTLTASGKPLLANDPHLGTRLPSTWYLAHMSAGDFDVIGATLPGAPAVALGRNRFIAWGATNVAADVQDLYRERIDASGRFAEFRGAQEPLTIVPETIAVKNGAPVHLDVRISRHGPLVSDAINANNAGLPDRPKRPPLEPLAFRWTALDPGDTTLASFLRLNDARNWKDFTAALGDFVVPSQNFVYGDVDGHIGYYAPGRIPVRASGDGALPADGWSGDAEWTGWVPFGELPHTLDPPEHFIVTANNRPGPAGFPHMLGLEWPEPYRAQRIVDLLRQKRGFTPDDFARMQADTLSLHAKALLPVLLPRTHPETALDRQALELLGRWNQDAKGDSAAAAVFEAWFLQLAPTLVGDELGPVVTEDYQGRFSFVARFLIDLLQSDAPDGAWCDDVKTKKRESCDEEVTRAFQRAVAELTRRLGANPTRWRWDAVHRAVFPHQGLDTVAAFRPLLSRSVPNGGDWSTINVGPVSANQPYEQRSVPGYREIIDLSPADDSRFLDAVGESGHFLSPHYDDFLPDWAAVRYRRMRTKRVDVENGAKGRLRLTPR